MGPRLFCIPARDATTIAVIRRGPSAWCHVSRWDPAQGTLDLGAWLHGTVYPQRCDLSPDGRWLASFVLKAGARWSIGSTYLAVSRLPWLTALAAWETCGTWTRGLTFVDDRERLDPGEPQAGDIGQMRRRFGLAGTRAESFAVERRHGWTETADTPPRSHADAWDEQREVIMEKARPGGGRLMVRGRYAAFRDMGPAWGAPRYALDEAGHHELEGVQWADWDASGRLLVATTKGALEVRAEPFDAASAVWRYDLGPLRPQPTEPPAEASRW